MVRTLLRSVPRRTLVTALLVAGTAAACSADRTGRVDSLAPPPGAAPSQPSAAPSQPGVGGGSCDEMVSFEIQVEGLDDMAVQSTDVVHGRVVDRFDQSTSVTTAEGTVETSVERMARFEIDASALGELTVGSRIDLHVASGVRGPDGSIVTTVNAASDARVVVGSELIVGLGATSPSGAYGLGGGVLEAGPDGYREVGIGEACEAELGVDAHLTEDVAGLSTSEVLDRVRRVRASQ